MFLPDDPQLPLKVRSACQALIAKAQAGKLLCGDRIETLNEIEDRQIRMIEVCSNPAASPYLDRGQLAVYGQEVVRLTAVVDSGNTDMAYNAHATGPLVYASGVTATTAVTPLCLVETAPTETRREVRAIVSKWIAPDRVHAVGEQVVRLLCATGCQGAFAVGYRSPVDHFRAAWTVYQQAPESANHPLPPLLEMRSCIDATKESLLRRRRTQRKAGGAATQVRSLLEDLGKAGSNVETVNLIVKQYECLCDRLSGSKQADGCRRSTGLILFEATEWLAAFLECIDVGRLREV
jgi:hypothetical protein